MSENFPITFEERKRGKVAFVEMNCLPPINTFNIDLLRGFIAAMHSAADQADVVIVTSANDKFFSNGLDGKTLLSLEMDKRQETITAMIRAFGDLLEIKKPWMVEIAGHAMAGGAVISLAADFRFMLTGAGRIGFSELAVGLPLPLAYIHGMHHVVQAPAIRLMIEGTSYKPAEALDIGFIDGAAESPEKLRAMTLKRADGIMRMEPDSYLPTREIYRGHLLRMVRDAEDTDVKLSETLIKKPVFDRALNTIAGKNRG